MLIRDTCYFQVTVLLVAASCSVANARSPKRPTFDASPKGDEYFTQSSYSSAGESQKISRKHRPSLGSSQSSSNFSPISGDQKYYDQFTQPSRAQRRSRKYITSDKIRSKQRGTQVQRLRNPSKDYSREYFPPGSSDQYNTNQYDQAYQSIEDWKEENPNQDDGFAKLNRQEDFSQYSARKENGYDQSADYGLDYDNIKNEQRKKIKTTTNFYHPDDYGQFDTQQQNTNDHLIDFYKNYNPIKNQQIKNIQPENSYTIPKTNYQFTNSYEHFNPYNDQLKTEKASTSFSPPENQYSVLKLNGFDQSTGSRENLKPVQDQSPLNAVNVPTKYSQPENFSHFNGYSVQIPNNKTSESNENKNPVKSAEYSQNTFLPSTEIKPATPQYLPPAKVKDYYLPSQADITTNEYLPSDVNKPYEQYLPSQINNPAEEFQPIIAVPPPKQSAPPMIEKEQEFYNNTPLSYADVFFSNSYVTSEKPQQKDEYLPISESQPPNVLLVPSPNYQINSNKTGEHYNHFKESEAPMYKEPEVITISHHFIPEDGKVIESSYLPQIEQPVFQEYKPDHNYYSQPEFIANGSADRRNDISATIQSNPTHSFMFPQKNPTVALRPIKRFDYGNSPFQNSQYPIDRSSLDQSPLKLDALNSNFVSQSSLFDPANSGNQFIQSGQTMSFGSKIPQQGFNGNNVYASSRSSNIALPIQQVDLPYETSNHGLNSNNNNVAPYAANDVRPPTELIMPNQSQNLQQQANSYASNFAHHLYSQESTTEEVPILKQTNEIAYDGSFHYE